MQGRQWKQSHMPQILTLSFSCPLRKHPGFMDRRHVSICVPKSDGPGTDRWVWQLIPHTRLDSSICIKQKMLMWFNFDVFSYEHQPLRRELQDPDVCRVHPGEAGKGEVWPDGQNLGRGRLGEVALLLHYFCWVWLSQVHLCCITLHIST